jgi:hypothetical protein
MTEALTFCGNQVRTLGIEMQLLESDVVKLANILAGEGSDCQLQNLGLEVAVFDSGLLPLLARSFPFLQSLYLIYRRRGATSRDHNVRLQLETYTIQMLMLFTHITGDCRD